MLSLPSLDDEDGPSEFDLPPASTLGSEFDLPPADSEFDLPRGVTPRKSLADFFPPEDDDEDEGYDPFGLPPVAAPIREGELGEGGRYDDAAEGRTEGYYAGLAEAPDRLRASDLNELLLPGHLDRLRFTNFPLQAYGAVFKWETLVENSIEAYRGPWAKVAQDNDLPLPDDDDVLLAVGMRPERAIMQQFLWTDDWGQTQKLAFEHFENKAELIKNYDFAPSEGVIAWLALLKEYEVPCCFASGADFDKAAAEQIMAKAGLTEYFTSCVTAEDGCETPEQTYLVGSIKVRRPPSRCVVFEDHPKGIAAAHEATSKVVAINNPRHGSDLRHAEIRVTDFSDLSLMSLRNLFKDAPPI